jgi:uncharacterized repeat protein (TIGR01451 family)
MRTSLSRHRDDRSLGRAIRLVALPLLALLGLWTPAAAETNSAIGGIAGLDNGTLTYGDGTVEATISLGSTDLALVKQARDTLGAVLADGATVAPGDQVYFVLYIDNVTSFLAEDVRITDSLDESQFSYVPDSLEWTTVATGSDDATIWAGSWTGLTDALGGPDDSASVTDTGGTAGLDRLTVGAQVGQANQTLQINGLELWAIRFRVTVE